VNSQIIFAFVISLITAVIATPVVMKLAFKIGAIDKPNARKVHQRIMPRLGGLAIFIGVAAGYFASGLYHQQMTTIIVGALIIVGIGILDDVYELSAKVKLIGQIAAAVLIVKSGLTIDHLTIPLLDKYELGVWAYPVTVIWIVAITNAINLSRFVNTTHFGYYSSFSSIFILLDGLY